jgi:hypothetical protein
LNKLSFIHMFAILHALFHSKIIPVLEESFDNTIL